MRIEQLYYLSEVSKTNSITLAAKRIHVSQQNISVAIRKLEEELGIQIINRLPRGVTFTKEGKRFVKKADHILLELENLKTEFQFVANKQLSLEGSLSIVVTPFFNNSLLPDIVIEFKKLYPKIHIHIKEMDLDSISSEIIKDNQIDFGLGCFMKHDTLKDNPEIEYEELYIDKVFACVGNYSPLASRKSISTSAIIKQPIALMECNKDLPIEQLLKIGHHNELFIASNYQLYRKTIIEGHALTFIMGTTLNKENLFKKDEIIAIPIRENITVNITLIKPSQRPLSPLAEEFINVLRSHIIGL